MTKAELIEMVKHHEEGARIIVGARGLKIFLDLKGSWNPQEAYTFLDLVEYQNEIYVSRSKNGGVAPDTDSKAWATFDEFYSHCYKGEYEEETK